MENENKNKSNKLLIPLAGVLVFLLIAIVGVNVLIKVRNGAGVEKNAPVSKPVVKTEQGNPRVINPQPADLETTAITASTGPSIVTIAKGAFSPATVTVAKGTVVTFKNDDTVDHKVVGTSKKWGSMLVTAPGEAYSQAFEVAGTYDYYCEIHPEMKGSIVVE